MRKISTCERQDIKHVMVCGSSVNFPAKILRKSKMPEIRLNCLVVPEHSKCAPCFDDIPITQFVIRAVEISSNDLANDNTTVLFLSIKNGTQGTELSPISNISPRFSIQPPQDNIHIIVYLKIKTPQQ
ncbi:hypothetical protein GLOIN_2v1765929 [Rhizophagus irregularis DAOM 181602=DAOM 197198]|nr:hypothetical protein GLOIN_2v1765929 [Rhizophagus irregularis DAOM 181602=DAOM 197198]